MTLSEYEKHQLDEIELGLRTDHPDPDRSRRSFYRISLAVGVASFLAGLQVHNGFGTALAIVGYVVATVSLAQILPSL